MRLKKYFMVLISAACILLFAKNIRAEFIFIKSGDIIECKIVGDKPDNVNVRLKGGKTQIIYRKDILRILYTNLYMGKVYVQMIDGKGLELYMVDEDQDEYTFRKELYQPEETKIKRGDVLFISRKNPSGLQGTAGAESISLTWRPPYNQVRHYKVYVKEAKEDNYRDEGTSVTTNYTVKKLKSNTAYSIIVTAIDKSNYESKPSNEITVSTKNFPPLAPGGFTVTRVQDGTTLKLSWKEATDPDGKVTGYEVYQTDSDGTRKLGKTDKLEYTVNGFDKGRYGKFYVRAIDNLNEPSERSDPVILGSRYAVTLLPAYALPVGNFGKLHGAGYGISLRCESPDTFKENLDIGLEAGMFLFKGKRKDEVQVDRSIIIPLMLTIAYRYELSSSLCFTPRFSAGASRNSVRYDDDAADGISKYKWERQIEPMASAGFALAYTLSDHIAFSLTAEYRSILESADFFGFALFGAGLGIKF